MHISLARIYPRFRLVCTSPSIHQPQQLGPTKDFLELMSEYYAVVLQFSATEIQLGFAGESMPHVTLSPLSPIWKKFQPPTTGRSRRAPRYLGAGSRALEPEERAKLFESIESDPITKNVVDQYTADLNYGRWTHWHTNEYQHLARLLKYCVVQFLLVLPANCKFFITDPNFLALQKYHLGSSLLKLRVCAALVFLPQAQLSAISAGLEDSVVVDFASDECTVTVLGELRVLASATFDQYSEETVHYKVVETRENLDFNEVREFILGPGLGDDEKIPEILSLLGGLPGKIANLILKLDIDAKAEVCENIVFTGAILKSPGLKKAIIGDVQKFLPHLHISGKSTLGSWAGASLYCSTTLLRQDSRKWKHMEVSRGKLETDAWNQFLEI